MSVSVVIACYRGLPVLQTQLQALADQDYSGAFEVILADNAGEPELAEYVEHHPLADRLSLRWVDASDVAGTSHARNVGTRAARYGLIAYCDQDDAVHPEWLRSIVDGLAGAEAVGGPLERETLNDPIVASWRALPDPAEPPVLGRFLPISFGCNLGVRREVFDAIGGWNEDYPNAGGDVEFCWRIQTSGHSFGYAPQAMVAYRYRTGMRESWNQVVEYGREEVRVARQYGAPGRQWWWTVLHVGVVAGTSPIWPWAWSRSRRGQWVWVTGNLVGRVQGSIRHRYRYL